MKPSPYLFSIIPAIIITLCTQCTSGNSKTLHKELSDMARKLNTDTPVMLDMHTQFDSASVAPDNTFRYHYTIKNTENPTKLIEDLKNELDANIKEAFSSSPDLKIFRENNLSIQYIYNDSTGKTISQINVSPQQIQH